MSTGTFTASGSATIGNSNLGTFTQSGGSSTFSGNLYLGSSGTAIGTFNLSGGTLSAATEYVGVSAIGTFNQTGGNHTASANLYVGENSGSTGTYNQSAGATVISNSLYLGYNSGASGTYALSGTGTLAAAAEYIGNNPAATAALLQTGGANTVTNLSIGSSGQYLLSGGTLTVNGSLINNGTVQRRRRHGVVDGKLPGGPHLRRLEKLLRLVRQRGRQRPADRPQRLQYVKRICRPRHIGFARPRSRHAAGGARGRRLWGRRHDQRPRQLPRHDRRRIGRHTEPD